MVIKKIVLSLFLVVLLIITACSSGKDTKSVESPYFGGSQGLIAIVEDIGLVNTQTQKQEVFEDESFPISVLMNNKGEYTIPANSVKLSVKGISPSDFTGIDFFKTNTKDIDKMSEALKDGGEESVFFGDAQYKGVVGTFYDANVFVEYIYPYESYIAIPRVCYKGDPKDKGICELDEVKPAFISAGPIGLGTVVQRPAGKGRITLEIPIRNLGATQDGKVKAYDFDDFTPLYDQVAFQVQTAGWTCTARGNPNVARMVKNSDVVILCRYDNIGEKEIFTSQVDIKLTYFYKDFTTTKIRIRENLK
ncbi:hypothetical protein J4232_04960 [Candidatus Woesearchaeota archaeon]|nr:hypothetical protein [Candidatus Woesearchaeota archaeon]